MRASFVALLSLLILGCKTDPKPVATTPEKEQTILEKVAYAHGFENWKEVSTIQFTFNVDRDSSHFERTWIWKPKSNHVTGISLKDTISYNRNVLDSISYEPNAAFVNDKFWLLAPYNLIWDKDNISHEHSKSAEAPISKKTMQKLTIVYGSEGGYTPGDAYDFYFEDDYVIKEWVFRKSNQLEPNMSTTWEDYDIFSGIPLAQMHMNAEKNFKLSFSNLAIKK